ncbi:hypothetical protein [uncultured Duncaniella sp.]|jgi:hypothetical protein|uniref:hypothetical protein n=1 Tax=uncultured Duncaniella sp. TaxID=2768039 RepID=UPI0026597A7F|nr:hypothetical protein [uncultured Duncaniella sp.]
MNSEALKNLVIINGKDIWTEFGAFLTEEKKGGRENLTSIMSPSKVKTHVAVNIREENGSKYSSVLDVKNEERDVTLHFALFAESRSEWLQKYRDFITFLKEGENGWLSMRLPELNLTMRLYYVESSSYKPLTYLWKEGVHASRFKVKFREPVPSF